MSGRCEWVGVCGVREVCGWCEGGVSGCGSEGGVSGWVV